MISATVKLRIWQLEQVSIILTCAIYNYNSYHLTPSFSVMY